MCNKCKFESDYWDLQEMLREFRKKRNDKNEEVKSKSGKKSNNKGNR